MVRAFLLAAVSAVALMSSANAADIYRVEDPGSFKDSVYVPGATWTGFYVGVNGGYGWSSKDARDIRIFNPNGTLNPAGPYRYGLDEEGAFGGGQAGYNYQLGRLVLGFEADVQASDIIGKSKTSFASQLPLAAAYDYAASKEADWFGTARARLGWLPSDSTLIYATGGVAFGKVAYNAHYIFTDPGCCTGSFGLAKASETATGFVVGGGLEQKLSGNWSIKAEYQYVDLGSRSATGALFFATGAPSGETFKTRYESDFHTVRVGLNYAFGSGYEPLK
jgi:outer membrane immunogenic protein